MKFSMLVLRLIQNLPLHPREIINRDFSSINKKQGGKTKTFNTPHPPKDPPDNYNPPELNHSAFEAPDFMPLAIFRPFQRTNEPLGPGASKCEAYKNPEYYAYHRYSFTAMQLESLEVRKKRLAGIPTTCFYEQEEVPPPIPGGSAVCSSSSSDSSSGSSSSSSSSDDDSSDECDRKKK